MLRSFFPYFLHELVAAVLVAVIVNVFIYVGRRPKPAWSVCVFLLCLFGAMAAVFVHFVRLLGMTNGITVGFRPIVIATALSALIFFFRTARDEEEADTNDESAG